MRYPPSGANAGSASGPAGVSHPSLAPELLPASDALQRSSDTESLADDESLEAESLTRPLGTRLPRRDSAAKPPANDNPLAAEKPLGHENLLGANAAERAKPLLSSPMDQPHSRLDVISGRWTMFANQRGDRPNDFEFTATPKLTQDGCPFCRGNEQCTPEPVLVLPWENSAACPCGATEPGDWGVRVVPNKYPAVATNRAEGAASREDLRPRSEGSRTRDEQTLFPVRAISGGHEVFIESPEHYTSLVDLDLAQVVSLLKVYQARIRHWVAQPSIRYVSLFKNAGPAAGASLLHPHSQLIAVTELPNSIRGTLDRFRRHHARSGCCLQCDVLRAELDGKRRLVAVTDSHVVYCPFASYLPMLMRITTRRHVERYEDLSDSEIDGLARLIRRAIGWLNTLYPGVAYNFLIHTRPPAVGVQEGFHWSFELFPRLTQIAGFEWSCETIINPMLPEDAAAQLREVALRENPLRQGDAH